ncbi:hypothetical protein GCM10010156_49540 [Planobispora rosea]|uniref:Uncharacterized protein n=1 Tax=Planobispora rosea TaxID=35762 RepID=A0A8J3WEJ6_PLARO|nr:hypothetical protein [Planobispora rosea]GGS85022.1 hypothetical protein GCM10010156_49540 [Planobispora rosea]GIH86465.1 hypothetical protein Pro02_48730 [Planobispora rosea]
MSSVPIPKRLSGCPVQGGLAVPAVAAHHRGGRALFGINHPGHVNTFVLGKQCGVCGQPLSRRPGGKYALLLRPVDFTRGYSSEPALHPADCASYARRACPLLNGDMTRYRATPRDLEAERCGDPACDCRLWTNSAESHARADAEAPTFYLAIYRQEDYRPYWGQRRGHHDVLCGVTVTGITPLSVQRITHAELSPFDIARVLLLNLPLK